MRESFGCCFRSLTENVTDVSRMNKSLDVTLTQKVIFISDSIIPWLFIKYVLVICGNKLPTRCNRCFLLQILLLAQHVSGTIMPIIRSSRVLYRWLLHVVFGALVFKLSVWCGAEGCVSGLHLLGFHYNNKSQSGIYREEIVVFFEILKNTETQTMRRI